MPQGPYVPPPPPPGYAPYGGGPYMPPPPPPPHSPYHYGPYAPQPPPSPYPPATPPDVCGPRCTPIATCGTCTTTCTSRCCCEKPAPEYRSVIGVRGTLLDVRGSDRDGATVGAIFSGLGDHYDTKGIFTWRANYAWGLGGGAGGVEGGLGMTIAGGVRAPFGDTHGPLVRVGGGGELWGNSRFYFSRLTLPTAEAGYQFLDGATVVELVGNAAPILGGRYNVGDASRRETSSGFQWGGSAVARASFGRLSLGYTRIELPTRAIDTPIDVLNGELCGYIGHFGICGNAHVFRGDVRRPDSTVAVATTVYGGVTLGYATW